MHFPISAPRRTAFGALGFVLVSLGMANIALAEEAGPSTIVPQTRIDPKAPRNTSPDPRNFEGVWTPRPTQHVSMKAALGTNGVMATVEGTLPPLNAEAQNTFYHRLSMEQLGTPVANTATTCRPGLAIKALQLGRPTRVQQTGDKLFFYLGTNRVWFVYLNRDHPKNLKPSYMGDSVGHWEGPTLVVDTIGFTDRTWIDLVGLPHSPDLHIITRINKILNGTALLFLTTIDDPRTYTAPWTTAHVARFTDDPLEIEADCLENNRLEGNEEILFEDGYLQKKGGNS